MVLLLAGRQVDACDCLSCAGAGHEEVEMSSVRRGRFSAGFSGVEKKRVGLASVALLFAGLFCSKADAAAEMLSFERVPSSESPGVGGAANAAPKSTAKLVDGPGGVRVGKAPVRPLFARSEFLEFEKVSTGGLGGAEVMRSSDAGVRRRVDSQVGLAAVKVVGVPGVSAVAYGRAPDVAAPGGSVLHTESELREVFRRAAEQAAERSPSVRRAFAQQSASLADVDEAKGQRLPQVDVGMRSKSVSLGGGVEGANGQSVGVDVVTPVFDWGRIRKTIEGRSYLASAADSALRAELEVSAFDVSSNLIELGKQRAIVDISQRFVDRMAELVRMLEGIVAVDTGRVSELTQARARLLQAETSRASAESMARDVEINLRKMLGEGPLPALPRSPYWRLAQPDMEWLLGEVVQHPLILQAEAEAKSADLQADVVRSSSLPQLNWVVGKSTAEDALGREQAWQTSLSLSWSAFRGGSQRAAERAARQRAEAGRQVTEQQALDLEYRIRAAGQDAKSMVERADLYRRLTVESEQVRKAFYEQWYHLGRRTLLDVLISESDHYSNQVGEITNRFESYAAIMRQYSGAGVLVSWLGATR